MLAVILPPDIGWRGNNLLKACTGKQNQFHPCACCYLPGIDTNITNYTLI